MEKKVLKVEKRKEFGRKVKKLRGMGIIPGNIYGSDYKSVSVQVDEKEFLSLYSKTGETTLIDLEIGGDKQAVPVLIHDVQVDPIDNQPIHVDFLKVNLKKKVTANVPLEITGESPAEKQGLGTLVQHISEIEVEALPQDLPENVLVDVSNLIEAEQSISIKDLKYDKDKVTINIDSEEIVVKIEVQKIEVEVAPTPAVPVEGEAAPAEGQAQAPAEGEEKGTAQEEEKSPKS